MIYNILSTRMDGCDLQEHREIAATHFYIMNDSHLYFFGYCDECHSKMNDGLLDPSMIEISKSDWDKAISIYRMAYN